MLAPRGNHLSNALQNRDSVYNAALSKKVGTVCTYSSPGLR